jgi:hypothetical protein
MVLPSASYSRELPAVQAHLERFFRVVSIFTMGPVQWLTVLERDSDRGESAIDLLAQIATAQPFVRGTDGSVAPAPTLPQLLATQYNRRPMAFVLGPGGGGLDFDVTIPERAVFQGSVGLRRLDDFSIRHKHPPVTSLRASLRPVDATQTTGGPTGEFARLVESPAMQGRFAGRHWTHLEADLSDYAGQRVTLRLELIASRSLPGDSIGWWGSPRIALSAEPLDSADTPESPSRAEQSSRVSPQ